MSRPLHKLSAVAVRALAPGKHSDGGGLWLHKREDGGGQWVLRVTVHGRRREMGLGSTSDVALRDARESASRWRAVARDGRDPIKERERIKREAARGLHLLSEIAADAFDTRKAELKGDGAAGRWFSPLAMHVLPKLGKVPVADLDQTDIRDALAPIWQTKAVTARKALNRLGICLAHAAALGLQVDLQATDKALALLGQQRHKATNIPAMPWQEVPAFYASLSEPTITQLALRLTILTAARSGPVRFIRPDEQIEDDIWKIPGENMKGRRDRTNDFRVVLSTEAVEVIRLARPFMRNGYLFPNTAGGVISDMTMLMHMKRAGLDYRPHGFRSSLRDWIAETTNTPFEVAETVLGHSVGGKVERAYRRTDYLEQRRVLMERWADFVTGRSGQLLQIVRTA